MSVLSELDICLVKFKALQTRFLAKFDTLSNDVFASRHKMTLSL